MTQSAPQHFPIYMIRHAQSKFNAAFDRNKPDPMMFDSELSEIGRGQAISARKNFDKLDISHVIISPFTRTIETASLIFGDDYPFEINADVREQLSNSCDVGSSPVMLKNRFPHLEFSHLPEIWWHNGPKDHRGISIEPHEILMARVTPFVDVLRAQNSGSTAIVTHGNFIHAITGQHTDNCEITGFDPRTGAYASVAVI